MYLIIEAQRIQSKTDKIKGEIDNSTTLAENSKISSSQELIEPPDTNSVKTQMIWTTLLATLL